MKTFLSPYFNPNTRKEEYLPRAAATHDVRYQYEHYYICGIIPKVKFVPEAQPRDTNNRGVLFLLSTLGRKHILMARSIAEGPNFY